MSLLWTDSTAATAAAAAASKLASESCSLLAIGRRSPMREYVVSSWSGWLAWLAAPLGTTFYQRELEKVLD